MTIGLGDDLGNRRRIDLHAQRLGGRHATDSRTAGDQAHVIVDEGDTLPFSQLKPLQGMGEEEEIETRHRHPGRTALGIENAP